MGNYLIRVLAVKARKCVHFLAKFPLIWEIGGCAKSTFFKQDQVPLCVFLASWKTFVPQSGCFASMVPLLVPLEP